MGMFHIIIRGMGFAGILLESMAIRMQIASVHRSPTCPRFLLMQIECREARMTQSRAVFVPAFAARRVSSTCFSATN